MYTFPSATRSRSQSSGPGSSHESSFNAASAISSRASIYLRAHSGSFPLFARSISVFVANNCVGAFIKDHSFSRKNRAGGIWLLPCSVGQLKIQVGGAVGGLCGLRRSTQVLNGGRFPHFHEGINYAIACLCGDFYAFRCLKWTRSIWLEDHRVGRLLAVAILQVQGDRHIVMKKVISRFQFAVVVPQAGQQGRGCLHLHQADSVDRMRLAFFVGVRDSISSLVLYAVD